jgi:hypothetical protein
MDAKALLADISRMKPACDHHRPHLTILYHNNRLSASESLHAAILPSLNNTLYSDTHFEQLLFEEIILRECA